MCVYSVPWVRIPSSPPRRNGLCSVPIFLCNKKISHTLRRSSSFAKRHARLACSLASALTTAHSRYHLFAIAPAARIFQQFGFAVSERSLLRSDFSLQKNPSHAPSFLLFRKKARSARLFACKRAHNGSQSLPPFCDCAFGANISTVWLCCVGTVFAPFRLFLPHRHIFSARC